MASLELSLEFDKTYIKKKKLIIEYNISSFTLDGEEASEKEFEKKLNALIQPSEKAYVKLISFKKKSAIYEFNPEIWLKKTMSNIITNTPDRFEKKIKIGSLPSLVENNTNPVILDQIVDGTFRNLLNTDLKLKNKILKSMSELNDPLISYFLYKYDGNSNSIIISLKPEFRINPLLLINSKSKKEVSKMGFDKSVHTFISVYNKKK